MDDARSDVDCIAAAAAGDRSAFEMIARRYQQRLIRYAGRSLGLADSQDVVQDVLVKAFVNLHRYNPRWPVATWLFTLTRHATVDCLRKNRRTKNLIEGASAAASTSGERTTSDADRRDLHSRLWAIAAERLSEEQVQAMWLHYVEDLGTQDVGRVMGRSWVWVKTALHRGRKTLAPHVVHLSDVPADERMRINKVAV